MTQISETEMLKVFHVVLDDLTEGMFIRDGELWTSEEHCTSHCYDVDEKIGPLADYPVPAAALALKKALSNRDKRDGARKQA